MEELISKKIKSEKGSVTLFVLATMIFFITILFLTYFSEANKINTQMKQIALIQEEYNVEGKLEEIYNQLVEGNVSNQNEISQRVRTANMSLENMTVDNLQAGEYVNYIDNNGDKKKCVVLWDSNSNYGVQITTTEVVENVTLGNETSLEEAIASYNNAIITLNTKATAYLNSKYATSARSIGSMPNNPNSESQYYQFKWNMTSYKEAIKGNDQNYEIDFNQLIAINQYDIQENYWMASRYLEENTNRIGMGVWTLMPPTREELIAYNANDDNISQYNVDNGLRPVFTLKSEIKIAGGEGTESNPYELGV